MAAASAPKRQSALAASRPLFTATARSLKPRTRLPAPGARAVSPLSHQHCHLTEQSTGTDISILKDQRPAGECTCSRATKENSKPAGSACACGKRSEDACNCGGSEVGKASDLETDFTTKASGA